MTFTFETNANKDQVEWKVTPDRNVLITALGKSATIRFGEAGNYLVTASDRINLARSHVTVDTTGYTGSDTLNVNDSTATHIPPDTIKPEIPDKPVVISPSDTAKVNPVDTVGTHNIFLDLHDARFVLTPSIVDSLSASGLAIYVESENVYKCLNAYLGYNSFFKNPASKIYRLNLYNVVIPGAKFCNEGTKKVSANTFLYPLSEGDNIIEVVLNGNVYAGTITKTGKTFSINWPDTSVIRFSKLNITK